MIPQSKPTASRWKAPRKKPSCSAQNTDTRSADFQLLEDLSTALAPVAPGDQFEATFGSEESVVTLRRIQRKTKWLDIWKQNGGINLHGYGSAGVYCRASRSWWDLSKSSTPDAAQ